MSGRPLLVLVILAALYGAPSPASAAGNELSAATVTPTAGAASTAFTFGVRYDGRSAAVVVTARVAGLELPMHLSAGTPLDGTWTVAATLPPGTWPVTFVATPERGNQPTIAGPTVTVAGHQTPAPPVPAVTSGPYPAPPAAGRSAPASSAPAGAVADAPTPAAAAAPKAGERASESTAPRAAPSAGAGVEGAPSASEASEPGAPEVAGGVQAGAPEVGTGPSPAADEYRSAAPAADGVRVEHAADTWRTDDGLVVSVLLVGLAGVAAVALIGTAVLLARRRGEKKAAAAPGPVAADVPRVDRRTARRRKLGSGDDPILAALGLGGDDEPRRARRRVGQVGRGRDEGPDRTPPT